MNETCSNPAGAAPSVAAACSGLSARAAARGITGKVTKPFLLQRVNELTGGQSLAANIALIKGAARLAWRWLLRRSAEGR